MLNYQINSILFSMDFAKLKCNTIPCFSYIQLCIVIYIVIYKYILDIYIWMGKKVQISFK